MGSIYQRGKTWWISYYSKGRRIRESTNSDKKMVATKLLQKREGEIADSKVPSLYFERVKYITIRKLLLDDYKLNKRKSLDRVQYALKHLDDFFSGWAVPSITVDEVNQYILHRVDEGAKNATINRELSALKRMLSLAQAAEKAGSIPKIKLLQERNVRKGFFEHGEFLTVRESLPDYLQGFVTFAYKTGWRVSEIINLTWPQVDRKNWIVRIDPGESKNDEARTIYLDKELIEVFKVQWQRRRIIGKVLPYVFTNYTGKDKIGDFRVAWKSACKKAGFQRHFHDLRRTAARNMVRAGIPERVAMTITGHKTRSIFDRYNIVSENDLKKAAGSLEGHLKHQVKRQKIANIKK